MNTESKLLGLAFLVTAILIGGAVFFFGNDKTSVESDQGEYQIDYAKGHSIGNATATVKLVEFSDLQCPACAGAAPFVKEVIEKNSGNLQFIYRHYPLPIHLNGRKAAYAAEAAARQDKFWQMHDRLFATQQEWANLPSPDDFFINLAKQLELNEQQFRTDYSSSEVMAIVSEDVNQGNIFNVNSTPTFFLNGKKLQLQSFSDLQAAVEQEISASSSD